MPFVVSRLRSGEWIAGAGALVLFVDSFFDWYGLKLTGVFGQTLNFPTGAIDAWSSFTVLDVFLAATIIAAAALFVLQGTQRSPALPVTFSVLSTVFSSITALLILIRIISPPAPPDAPPAIARLLSRTVEAGAWVGLAATIAILVGSWRSLREEGLAPADERTDIETIALGGGRP